MNLIYLGLAGVLDVNSGGMACNGLPYKFSRDWTDGFSPISESQIFFKYK
jgi:hypothetical protein